MGLLTKAIGAACALYAVYIVFIFFAFTIDLRRDFVVFQQIPSVNDGYDKPFHLVGLIHMVSWISLFSIHHSLFARRWMVKYVSNIASPSLERSIYLFITALLLDWMIHDEKIHFGGGILWNIKWLNECNFFIRNSLALIGFLYFNQDLFKLECIIKDLGILQSFGLNEKTEHPRLQFLQKDKDLDTSGTYKLVRHPLQTAFLFLLWCSPFMSLQKFVWGLLYTIYIVIGTDLEEKDEVKIFGSAYIRYQQKIPQLIPFMNYCPFGW